MTYWTPKMVEARLAEAVAALRQQASQAAHLPCATPSTAGPEAALMLFLWLDAEDTKLLWMRAESRPWKEICRHFGVSRATANRRVEYVLSVLAWKLNHQRLSARWSSRYLVARTRAVSRAL